MPAIETKRLLLRMFDPEDLDELARLFRDPQVMRYVGDGQPVSREETERALESIIRHWQTHGFGRWAAVDLQTQEFIGFGGLRSLFGTPEVVYHLASAHWGKGLATELARASLRFGFETHQFERIVAITKPLNAGSIHVMEKLGMHYAISREEFNWDGSEYLLKQET